MKKICLLFVSVLLLTGCGKATIQNIECSELDQLKEDGAILIDVRNISEFDEGHLDDAINIEYDTIGEKIGSVAKDKDTKIIVYCRSGNRSNKAATTLIDKGYKNVFDLGTMNKCTK